MGLKNWFATKIAHFKKDSSPEANESSAPMTVVIDKTGVMNEVTDGGTIKGPVPEASMPVPAAAGYSAPPQAQTFKRIHPDTSSGPLEISISQSFNTPDINAGGDSKISDDTLVLNSSTNTSDSPLDLDKSRTVPMFMHENQAPAVKDVSQILQKASQVLHTPSQMIEASVVAPLKKTRPKNMKLKRTKRGDIMLIRKWKSWHMLKPAFVATLFFTAPFFTGFGFQENAVIIGLGLIPALMAAREFMNETVFMVVQNKLSIEVYPLSLTFVKTYLAGDLAGVSVHENEGSSKKKIHAVDIHLKDGSTKILCKVRTAEEAEYIEDVLTRALELADIVEVDQAA